MDAIVVEVPAAFKAATQCCVELFKRVETVRQQAVSGARLEFAEVERMVMTLVQGLQCALHASLLSALDREEPRLEINGVVHRRALRASTTFYTVSPRSGGLATGRQG